MVGYIAYMYLKILKDTNLGRFRYVYLKLYQNFSQKGTYLSTLLSSLHLIQVAHQARNNMCIEVKTPQKKVTRISFPIPHHTSRHTLPQYGWDASKLHGCKQHQSIFGFHLYI